MLTPFFDALLDIFYPPTCVFCELDGYWLCEACFDRIDFVSTTDEIVSLGAYANPVLRLLLTHLKYRSARCLIPSLRRLLQAFYLSRLTPWPWVDESSMFLCAIPSDAGRVRARGLDHSRVLLELVHQELVPWATVACLLKRTRHVVQNASLPANTLRQANVKGAFQVDLPVSGAVLLMDDIYTTGATWHEAAQALKAAGADVVYGFVFARKEKKDE